MCSSSVQMLRGAYVAGGMLLKSLGHVNASWIEIWRIRDPWTVFWVPVAALASIGLRPHAVVRDVVDTSLRI